MPPLTRMRDVASWISIHVAMGQCISAFIECLLTAYIRSGLNAAGGAVYATLWDDSGVRICKSLDAHVDLCLLLTGFFSRDLVPTDIITKSPDPSTWGSPTAYWAASSCAATFFNDLSVVFDIVLGKCTPIFPSSNLNGLSFQAEIGHFPPFPRLVAPARLQIT